MSQISTEDFVSTRNACKLCAPLGAALVFRGIEGAIPILHGSQGCATYIRRYVISHFKEPIDVASSNFSESSAIFGGGENLHQALANVTRQYDPTLIGVATTCLSETIGDDVPMFIRRYLADPAHRRHPVIVHVSTPSYSGTHMDGFHNAVQAVAAALAEGGPGQRHLNLLPGFVAPADLRHLKEIFNAFGLACVMLPDYSDTLDGPSWSEYEKIPPGGTPLEAVRSMGRARATLQFGRTLPADEGAGGRLAERFQVPCISLGLPMGIRETDAFFNVLQQYSGHPVPADLQAERGRLIDSYIDGHKYVFGKRAVVYGEEDLVVGLTAFLAEIGVVPVLCASGARSGRLEEAIRAVAPGIASQITVRCGADFVDIGDEAQSLKPDLLIGSSKGYAIARQLGLPLVRVGFPVHDRVGGQRIAHLGYRGTQQLLDRLTNALLEQKQDDSPVGYSYL